ncbi:hypothetical protein MKW98_000656 [Papaver atlanticum]|uniref:Bet v I/Major latex protein domain-containing protein n=1 Tax=Papaver atlanticum TaxID=357466 RepID=A0AAD4T223_9MAGN|nr:hypothetical protein MKW98_000656 [Papaver atlanticum]
MKGKISKEVHVPVPASDLWAVYGTLELIRLIKKLLPEILRDFEVVVGDGGVGTVLKLTFPPDSPVTGYSEKFKKVDNDKRIKVTEVVEGGYLEVGFSLYRVTYEITEKGAHSSVIITIEYELDDAFADNASLVSIEPLEVIAKTIGKYLKEKKGDHANV